MLSVRYGGMKADGNKKSPWYWDENNQPAWRVVIAEMNVAVRLRFASRRDAECGKASLEAAGITTWEAMQKAGPKKVRRLLVENLRW